MTISLTSASFKDIIPFTMVETVENSPHTVLVVLGKNIGVDWTADRIRRTPGHLSPHSEINADAAGIALEEGLADEVIFTVTNTAGSRPLSEEEGLESGDIDGIGKPVPSEARLMAVRFGQIYPHLADRVSVQERSWDTNRDAKETRRLIDVGAIWPTDRVVLMTTGFHHPRAWDLFRKARVKAYGFISERILALRDPTRAKEYVESDLYKKELEKEEVVHAIQIFPFAADLITEVTKKSRTA